MIPSGTIQRYKRRLLAKNLEYGTINKYLRVIEEGVRADDLLTPLIRTTKEGNPSSAAIARSALLHWAAHVKDPVLEGRIRALEVPARPTGPVKAVLTIKGRDKVLVWSREHLSTYVHGIIVLLAYSGERPGVLIEAQRDVVETLVERVPEGMRDEAAKVLEHEGWTRLLDLLGTTKSMAAYAALRRILRAAAGALRLQPFPLEDFRRILSVG